MYFAIFLSRDAHDSKLSAIKALRRFSAGETFVQASQVDKAQAEADRARVELRRGGALDEYAHRLATLEAAIGATSEALQWRQKSFQDLEAAERNLELLQVIAGWSLGKGPLVRQEPIQAARF